MTRLLIRERGKRAQTRFQRRQFPGEARRLRRARVAFLLELSEGLRERVDASRQLFGRRVFRLVRSLYFFRLIARVCQFMRRVFRFRDVRRAFGDKRSVLRCPRV